MFTVALGIVTTGSLKQSRHFAIHASQSGSFFQALLAHGFGFGRGRVQLPERDPMTPHEDHQPDPLYLQHARAPACGGRLK